MKVKKMLGKLKDMLSAERQTQLKKYKSLKNVLKSLRAEKNRLEKEISEAVDEESRDELATRLDVLNRQRKKGLHVLEELKKERKKQDT